MSAPTSPAAEDPRDERFTLAYWTELNQGCGSDREVAEEADHDLNRWRRSHAMGVRWAKDYPDLDHATVTARASASHAFSTKGFAAGWESAQK